MNPNSAQGLLPYSQMMQNAPTRPQNYSSTMAPNGGHPYPYHTMQQHSYPMMNYGIYPNMQSNYSYHTVPGHPPPLPHQGHPLGPSHQGHLGPPPPPQHQGYPPPPPPHHGLPMQPGAPTPYRPLNRPQMANPSKPFDNRMTPSSIKLNHSDSVTKLNVNSSATQQNETKSQKPITPQSQNSTSITNKVEESNNSSFSSSNSLLISNGRREGWEKLLSPKERQVVENILQENKVFEDHLVNFEREFSKMSNATATLSDQDLSSYNSMWINWKDNLLNRRKQMILIQEDTLKNLYKDICQKYPLFSTQGIFPTTEPNQKVAPNSSSVLTQVSASANVISTSQSLQTHSSKVAQQSSEFKSSNLLKTQSSSLTQTVSKAPSPAPVPPVVKPVAAPKRVPPPVVEKKVLSKEGQAILSRQESLNSDLLNLFDGGLFCGKQNKFHFVRNEMKLIQRVLDHIRNHPLCVRRASESKRKAVKPVTPVAPPPKSAPTHAANTRSPLSASQPLRKTKCETSPASTSKTTLPKSPTKLPTVPVSSHSQSSSKNTPHSNSFKTSLQTGSTKSAICDSISELDSFSETRQDSPTMDLLMREHHRTVITTKSEMNTIKVQVSNRKPKVVESETKTKVVTSERQVIATPDLSERGNNIQVTIVNDRAKSWRTQASHSSPPLRGDGLGSIAEPSRSLDHSAYFESTYYEGQTKPERLKYDDSFDHSLYHSENVSLADMAPHTSSMPHMRGLSPTSVYSSKVARSPSPLPPPVGSRDAVEYERSSFKSDVSYRNPEYFTIARKYDEEPLHIQDMLDFPARTFRPPHIVMIIRGLPGSGKSYTAFQIRERELKVNPTVKIRLLSYDYYFKVKSSGKGFKRLEYESARELEYKDKLYTEFAKTVKSKFSTFVIVDAVFEELSDVHRFYKCAIENGYTPYVIEMEQIVRQELKDQISISTQRELIIKYCFRQNRHYRTLKEIEELYDKWELLPDNYLRIDAFGIHKNRLRNVKKILDEEGSVDSSSDDLVSRMDYREHSSHGSSELSRDHDRKRYRNYGESNYNESSYQYDQMEADSHYPEEPIANRYEDKYHEESYDERAALSPTYKRYRYEEERFSSRSHQDSPPRFQSEYFQGSSHHQSYYDDNYYDDRRRY